ncbi:MAG: hypothetical protein LUH50_11425 [Bacteroides intestinalis]|nr:hypothetical protein [Bacteroides intestinalis]
MHSRIFQISKTPINKECYLNARTLTQEDNSYFDYYSEIDDKIRKYNINCLVERVLPKGMFELTSENTMRYNGGLEQWKESFVADIRKKAEAINTANMMECIGPLYQLENTLKDPFDTAYLFYLDKEGIQSYAEHSFAFINFIHSLEVGATLYIGGIIDYHS